MRILLVMLLALVQANTPAPDVPTATIANGQLRASIYLPDAKAGYYRGARFDWSGVVSSLTYKDHEYFGQWFEQYDPTLHDAITGPVEEFLTGETRARLRRGGARRHVRPDRHRRAAQADRSVVPAVRPLRDRRQRHVADHAGKDRIEFVHTLKDGTGYAYTYRKTLRLSGESLIIEHELKNTGSKPIATTVYDHNFFTLDGKTTGPDNVVRFPFASRRRAR